MPLKTTGGYGSSIINWMRSIDLRRISTSPRQMKSFRCWYNDTRYWDWVGTLVSRPSSKIYLRISPAQLLGLFFFAKTTSTTLTRDNGGVVGGGCNEARGVWARGSEAGSCERVLGVMDCWLEAQRIFDNADIQRVVEGGSWGPPTDKRDESRKKNSESNNAM
jgi:hypothetical protein